MSLDTITLAAQEIVETEGSDSPDEATEAFIETNTRRMGRPVIHPFEGRAYLLKDEVVAARNNPEGFRAQMVRTYTSDSVRDAELKSAGVNATSDGTLKFTIQGKISEALAMGEQLASAYQDRTVLFEISKHAVIGRKSDPLYVAPRTIPHGLDKKGREVLAQTWADFRADTVYVYLTVGPAEKD